MEGEPVIQGNLTLQAIESQSQAALWAVGRAVTSSVSTGTILEDEITSLDPSAHAGRGFFFFFFLSILKQLYHSQETEKDPLPKNKATC